MDLKVSAKKAWRGLTGKTAQRPVQARKVYAPLSANAELSSFREAMMAYADLTPEQQQIVAEYVRQVRATIGEFARLLNHFEALDYMYDGQITAGWAALLNTDIITDGSGLAGVSELTKAQVTTLANGMDAVLTTYNTQAMRQLFVRVAGMTNTIG